MSIAGSTGVSSKRSAVKGHKWHDWREWREVHRYARTRFSIARAQFGHLGVVADGQPSRQQNMCPHGIKVNSFLCSRQTPHSRVS